jgi:hypothetical protein
VPCAVFDRWNSPNPVYVRLRSWSAVVLYSFFVGSRFSQQDARDVSDLWRGFSLPGLIVRGVTQPQCRPGKSGASQASRAHSKTRSAFRWTRAHLAAS